MLMSEALSVTGIDSRFTASLPESENHVRFHILKNFNERYTDQVRGRIDLKAGLLHQNGAAIRQTTKIPCRTKPTKSTVAGF